MDTGSVRMGRTVALIAWVTSACTGGSATDGSAADSSVPADRSEDEGDCSTAAGDLDACFVGDFFADCGGTGGNPRLGCLDDGGCRWFAHGCVPDEYVTSSCTFTDICCVDNWPFALPFDPPGLYGRFVGLGRVPWDRERAVALAVTVDPELDAGEATFTCTGTDPLDPGGHLNTPCTGWSGSPQARFEDTLTIVAPNTGVAGWYPWMELDLASEAGTVARLCAYAYSDFGGAGMCPSDADVPCADSGTIVIDRLPITQADTSGLKVSVDVMFGAFHFQGSFVVP